MGFHHPYKRLDVERQVRQSGRDWSEWASIDTSKNYQILDHLPEVDRERVPEVARPEALNDPLPFLKRGAWRGVDPEALLRLPPAGEPPAAGLAVPGIPGGAVAGNATRKTLTAVIMVRSLDFTVEPGKEYRYRVRVVVPNPEAAQGKAPKEFQGPWSLPTVGVGVP